MKLIDMQGNPIEMNSAYKYVFAQPGNDTTVLITKQVTDDKQVKCYDVCFGFEVVVEPEKLFKPLKYGFNDYEIKLINKATGETK